MSKNKTFFSCQSCGYNTVKWLGKCPDCGVWNSFVEEKTSDLPLKRGLVTDDKEKSPLPISQILSKKEKTISTGLKEFDRVLGGGVVLGSVVLIGGDPGIGKSTLLLQASARISEAGNTVLYVSGEESPAQIKIRGERLLKSEKDNLYIYAENCLENILREIKTLKPSLTVIDSIQTIYSEEFNSAPGSVSQVRETANVLVSLAKKMEVPIFLIGHVTKDGAIAGPRVLEHLVDTVLYFEGERDHSFRILRSVKNRFGSTNEIGLFEMDYNGLKEVNNPSDFFLTHRKVNVAGSVVVAPLEGNRTILVEMQSLVCGSNNFALPKRMTAGVDFNRVSLLVAVLEKRLGYALQQEDIFINVAGGLKLNEPAIDLGIIAAISSSFRNVPIDSQTVVIGEVGLGGEIRGVPQLELRVREAAKLGFNRTVIPKEKKSPIELEGLKTVEVESVEEAMDVLFH